MPLSNVAIRNIKPELKAKKYADGDGLFLYVNTNGTKSWRFRYRDITGKEKEITFGAYPELSLLGARDKRFAARKLLSDGKDPNTEQKQAKNSAKYNAFNTFNAVANEWIELKKNEWTKKYEDKVRNRLKKYVSPIIGNKPIIEVNGLDILGIIRKIEEKGKTETSHKLLQNCSAILGLAFLTRRIPYNPLAGLKGVLKSHKPQSYPTIRINEVPNLLEALHTFNAPRLDKLAIQLLLLTFVRQGELRKAEWTHFDLEKGIWCIPAELMKMRREHLVPLSKQVINILTEIKKISGNDKYLFPSKNKIKHPYMNENVINNILKDKKMGYNGRLVGHGFRSLASTTLNELGWYHPQVIEKQLAHEERNKVRAAYNRAQYLPQRIEMMQRWADHIDCVVLEHKIKNQKNVA